ncbi:transcription-repair coupling factor [Helicobacter fennelliae]|uniref:transcription-repair coupling factor n=1 Tax=Helicobacter fennelliae TaxID=215 RepID=UPI000DF985BB|nr:transcription-repair coupling factor [Helicobacter fennelliae]STQ83676.1 transcription-repair coupling factor [Helicobacter fennelliae]
MIQANLYKQFQEGFTYRILLCQDQDEALKAYHLTHFAFTQKIIDSTPILLPEMRLSYRDDLRSFFVEFIECLAKVQTFYQSKNTLLIAPIYSLLYPMPSSQYTRSISLQIRKHYDLDALKQDLIHFGYDIVDVIEMEGEASFRGDIIDIYPPLLKPYRIGFFDDECEDIKEFDIATQLTLGDKLESIDIPPALFSLSHDEYDEILSQIQDCEGFENNLASLGFWFLKDTILLPQEYSTLLTQSASDELAQILQIKENLPDFWTTQKLSILRDSEGYSDVDFHLSALESIITHNSTKNITLLCKSKSLLSSLHLNDKNIKILDSSDNVNFITPSQIVLSLTPANTTANPKSKKSRPKIVLDELNIGDYVVHSHYGIGIFKGITQTSVLGHVRDFIAIMYQGDDKLLLPVENLHLIDRYIATSGSIPIIDRLGKGSFAKLKEKTRLKLFEIADSIIKLAAKRNLIQGQVIDVKNPELEVFRYGCHFTLTPDQERAISEIYSDISSGRVMDRLLSGDVGFGKTEVAMNAIFAVCRSGFQAALIVPTTLLCAQHFASLSKRLGEFGLQVAKLDRFSSAKDKKSIIQALKNGKIDVLIGTHMMFGLEFANLGLVVIDEEHKFGVKQKESIKTMSQNVHVLSMSATPIPRTLNMALSHIKGMSRLEIPPSERKDSRTFVKKKSDPLIKEIIHRELKRGGQVFYVFNNIAQIEGIALYLKDLMPHVRLAILHSQISATQTESIMEKFATGEFEILLCTSIVESGIHLPNANTIIIDGADCFGLADLHQLRGRVGRGDKEGFCYFLIDNDKQITKEATKRLLALEKNSYLGSGASIAHHDLEIRGGGNLIGESQSGHIKNIGYSLYLRLLEEAINTLSGKESISENGVELRISVSAYLNPELISSDRLRLELYRRLSLCKEVQEVYQIEHEIANRFGSLDSLSFAFIQIILIKILANQKNITSILHFGQNIQIQTRDNQKITLHSPSKDDEDVLESILGFLRK